MGGTKAAETVAKILARGTSSNKAESDLAIESAYSRMKRDGVGIFDILRLPKQRLYQSTLVRLVEHQVTKEYEDESVSKREELISALTMVVMLRFRGEDHEWANATVDDNPATGSQSSSSKRPSGSSSGGSSSSGASNSGSSSSNKGRAGEKSREDYARDYNSRAGGNSGSPPPRPPPSPPPSPPPGARQQPQPDRDEPRREAGFPKYQSAPIDWRAFRNLSTWCFGDSSLLVCAFRYPAYTFRLLGKAVFFGPALWFILVIVLKFLYEDMSFRILQEPFRLLIANGLTPMMLMFFGAIIVLYERGHYPETYGRGSLFRVLREAGLASLQLARSALIFAVNLPSKLGRYPYHIESALKNETFIEATRLETYKKYFQNATISDWFAISFVMVASSATGYLLLAGILLLIVRPALNFFGILNVPVFNNFVIPVLIVGGVIGGIIGSGRFILQQRKKR